MALANYIQTSFPIQAEQFEVSRTPWPTGVTLDEESGIYYIATEIGTVVIEDSDWVVINEGRTRVWTDPNFNYAFTPETTLPDP
jgi:hypothetical protein